MDGVSGAREPSSGSGNDASFPLLQAGAQASAPTGAQTKRNSLFAENNKNTAISDSESSSKGSALKKLSTMVQTPRAVELDEKFKWVLEEEWIYDKDVAHIMAIELMQKEWVPMGAVVGPAVPWAFAALAYVWITFLVMPYLGMWLTSCPNSGQLLASYPTWIWIFGLPFFAGCSLLEWKVLTYALLPLFHECWSKESKTLQSAVIRKESLGEESADGRNSEKTADGKNIGFDQPDTQGAFKVGFIDHHLSGSVKTWMAAISFVSFMNHLSIISNGLFLVKVLKSQQCATQHDFQAYSLGSMLRAIWSTSSDHIKLDAIWSYVMHRSSFARIPMIGPLVIEFSFVHLVVAVWAVMLLQPLYALVTSVPVECGSGCPDYKIGWSNKRHKKNHTATSFNMSSRNHEKASEPSELRKFASTVVFEKPLKLQYKTLTWKVHNHAQALFHLAEGARMASISALRARALRNYLQCRVGSGQGVKLGQEELNVLRSMNAAALARYVLIGLLENSVMLNIQITTLAMFAFVHEDSDSAMSAEADFCQHWQLYVSIVSSMFVGLWKVGDACRVMRGTWHELTNGSLAKLSPDVAGNLHTRRHFLRFEVLVVLACVSVFFIAIYIAVMKLVMLHICADHFWNFSWSLDQRNGCVNMSNITSVYKQTNSTPY